MDTSEIYDVIILGSGPAGLTAAIYTGRADLKTLLLAGSKWGGQLQLTTKVENFPGFPEGIDGPELMQRMRRQAEHFGVKIIDREFQKTNFQGNPFRISDGENTFLGKTVIIASGADTKWLRVPGEEKFIGKGLSSCAPCDAFFYRGKKVMVVGGGDSAMEEALVLSKFATSVIIVHRRHQFRASQIMQDRVKKNPKIHSLFNAEIVEILGKEKVEKVKLKIKPADKSLLAKSKEELTKVAPRLLGMKILGVERETIIGEAPIDGVFVAIGHLPNTQKLENIELDSKGFVKRKEQYDKGLLQYFTATNVPGVFTAGDIHDYRYKQAITAAGFGCMAALDVSKWLSEKIPSR